VSVTYVGTVPCHPCTGISGIGGVEHETLSACVVWLTRSRPRAEQRETRPGWLNEDNEIEPGENKKQLNKGMLG